jgi:hypothetical protein
MGKAGPLVSGCARSGAGQLATMLGGISIMLSWVFYLDSNSPAERRIQVGKSSFQNVDLQMH